MSPDIFIEDFERTNYSDYLHGVIGRALIVATRFDSMCIFLSMALDFKKDFVLAKIDDEDFDVFVNEIISKYRSLNNSIQAFRLPSEISDILHDARKARNEVTHSLTKGLEGCIDTKTKDTDFIDEVSELINKITNGDIIVSSLVSMFNKEPILNNLGGYKTRVINWVVEE